MKFLEKIPSFTKNLYSPPIYFQYLRFIYFKNHETLLYKLTNIYFQKLGSKGFYKNKKFGIFYEINENSNIC